MAQMKYRISHHLESISKWRIMKENLSIGDIVIVREDNSLSTYWPIALITKTHSCNDGRNV